MAAKVSVCCLSSVQPGQSRLFLPFLAIFILLYMAFGAAVFSSLEGPREETDLKAFKSEVEKLSQKHNISYENMKVLLRVYDEFVKRGLGAEDLEDNRRTKWHFFGAFVFSGTVVTTMGFGFITPNTTEARVFFVFYCLLGCSAVFLFFNSWLIRFIEYFAKFIAWMKRKRSKKRSMRPSDKPYKATPKHVLLALSSMTFIVVMISSAVYDVIEDGWDFLSSLYYCFTAFSTIGFGDFVSGQNHTYDAIDRYAYNFIDAIMVTLGCCCVYSLFNVISLFVKKFIEAVIERAIQVCNAIYYNEKPSVDKSPGVIDSPENTSAINNDAGEPSAANGRCNKNEATSDSEAVKTPVEISNNQLETFNEIDENEQYQQMNNKLSVDFKSKNKNPIPSVYRGISKYLRSPKPRQRASPSSADARSEKSPSPGDASVSKEQRNASCASSNKSETHQDKTEDLSTKDRSHMYLSPGEAQPQTARHRGNLRRTISAPPGQQDIQEDELPAETKLANWPKSKSLYFQNQTASPTKITNKERKTDEWVENNDVFPLSIMQNKMT